MFCVGLTGGIGCGKSTVAQMFGELGAAILDTDHYARALTQPGAPAYAEILHRFGSHLRQADESLDRAELRRLIFSDSDAKRQLENLLHPLIYEQVINALKAHTAPYALLVVPLLFETRHYLRLIQRSLVVDCSEASQIARTMARSHLSEAEVRLIMSHQVNRALRLREGEDIIRNDGDVAALQVQVTHLHAHYLALSRLAKS